ELARCGATVTITGRTQDVLDAAAEEIRDACGLEEAREVRTLVGDIREAADARATIEAVLARDGRLDVLVNNAGGQFFSPAELIGWKGWRAVWRLNVQGMLNMAEAAYELAFAPRGDGDGGSVAGGSGTPRGGRIVNVTLSPHHGMPGMAHSGAARAAVEALTRELAERWQREGVTVSAAAAGHFDTEVLAKYPASVRAGAARTPPLGRLGTATEQGWLVTLLASPLGACFNGSTVTLDGARDNWFGPWPPPGLADESGTVPVEERKARCGGEGAG